LITGRLTAAGLVLQADEGEETLLPFDIGSTRTLESAELVAMVEEQSSPGFRRTTAAVIDSAFSEVARAVVFDGPPSVATLLVMGADIYVARFERLFERLDGSRLRIARLDRALARVEPDRALDGWGGLGPTAIALVPWQDAPWLIWHTIDVRFGANPVLYALPLTEDACAGSVDRPLVVLSDTSATAPYAPMRVATDDIHLWIVTAAHSAGPLLRSYRLARCR
jgi:hypothetical protein